LKYICPVFSISQEKAEESEETEENGKSYYINLAEKALLIRVLAK
jgi:formate hydrogenlyase subunit 6/NADH:ubiquinone oxidoreductase subunit I